jgi:glycosyltransferase involved in cell wall biosynthesis
VYIFSPLEKTRKIAEKLYLYNIKTSFSSLKIYKVIKLIYNYPFFARKLILNVKMIEKSVSQLVYATLESIEKNSIELDVIQGEQEIPSMAAIRIAKKLNIPSIAHFHNVWAEEAIDIGLATKQDSTLKSLTKQITSQADLIITPTPCMLEYFKQNYSPKRVVYVPRGASLIKEDRVDYRPPYRVVYSGTLAKHENVDLYVKAANLVNQEKPKLDVEFYITGKGEDASKIKKLAEKMGLSMNFLWFPTKEEYQKFLSICHIGIIPWDNKISRRLGFPMKLLDYAAAGMVTIATNIGGWTEIVDEEKIGILVEPTPRDMAYGIIYLLTNPNQIVERGQRAQRFAGKQTWDKSAEILLKEYLYLLC